MIKLMPDNSSAIVTLRKALLGLNGESVTQIGLRAVTLGDLLFAGDAKNETERSWLILSAVSGVNSAVLKQLRLDDLETCQRAMDLCLGKAEASPETGPT